jgi:hypothetical protein
VIAMTCTHAALKRRELVDLGMYSKHRHLSWSVLCSVSISITKCHTLW